MTSAKTTIQLSTYDLDNISHLATETGCSKASAFHTAMDFCDKAIDYMQRGYYISALYEGSYARNTTATFSALSVAGSINNRRQDVEITMTDLPLHRATADRLENIKRYLKVTSDTAAVAFALEFSRMAMDRTHNANNGKKATIFFSLTNDPSARGYVMNKKHPYNANLGNSFRRAARRAKMQMAKMNPFTRKAAPPPALPAPASQPAQAEQPIQEIILLSPPTINKRTPNSNGAHKGGFGL
ncbi:MAG: hypothetical protein ACK4PK_03460 [Alphaproteobacteria bacterium]